MACRIKEIYFTATSFYIIMAKTFYVLKNLITLLFTYMWPLLELINILSTRLAETFQKTSRHFKILDI